MDGMDQGTNTRLIMISIFNYVSSKKWVPLNRWWVYTIWCRKELLSEVIIIFPSSHPNIGPAQGRG